MGACVSLFPPPPAPQLPLRLGYTQTNVSIQALKLGYTQLNIFILSHKSGCTQTNIFTLAIGPSLFVTCPQSLRHRLHRD